MPVRTYLNAAARIVPMLPLVFLSAQASTTGKDYRTLPCKTERLAPSCTRIHGRLWQGNGTPSVRLWQIGTHHIFGIYTNQYGFIHDAQTTHNEAPTLPRNIERERFRQKNGGFPYMTDMYADFDVCPLEPPIAGQM